MKRLFILISLLLISNTALATSLGDLKKTLEKATEEIEIQKENKTEKKVTNQNNQNLFVDNKISEQEVVKLIYCRYDFTREVIQNYDRGSVKYNLGDKKK